MEPGSVVNIYLVDPVERFWGSLLPLTAAGVTIRGTSVDQIEVFKYQLKSATPTLFAQTVFFPMRRVSKIDLDEAVGDLPSVIDSFKAITGLDEKAIFQ